MLDVEYKGANSIVISTKSQRLVIDPKVSLVGGTDIPTRDSIVLATESRFISDDGGAGESVITVEGPGEYEVGDISIRGVAAQRHIDTELGGTTMYTVVAGGIRVAILGNIASSLSEDQLEELGVVDLLVIPVGGGGYTLDSVDASKIVRQVEPKVVIPVHYHDDKLGYEVPQAPVDEFIKLFDTDGEDTMKYRIKTPQSLPEAMTVVKINRS